MAPPPADGTDGLPATMREIPSKLDMDSSTPNSPNSTMQNSYARSEPASPAVAFAITRTSWTALEAFIEMVDRGNFAKVIVRVGALPDDV
jgi:hypothetical protein